VPLEGVLDNMVHFTHRDEQDDCSKGGVSSWIRISAVGFLAAALAGCSMSFPLPSLLSDAQTGAIKERSPPFGDTLDAADWRVAEPSLAEALKSDSHAGPKHWSNPATGRGGAFQPVAGAFKRDGQTCRAFVARIEASEQTKTMQAIGCLVAGDAVFVDEAQPWKAL
jgi:hypothetical protein